MSSLMGYTRRHSLHFNPTPLPTSETGVRQAGHARIFSKSGSIAIALDVTIAAKKRMTNHKGVGLCLVASILLWKNRLIDALSQF